MLRVVAAALAGKMLVLAALTAAATVVGKGQFASFGVRAAHSLRPTLWTFPDMKDWFVAFAAAASLLWLTLWTAHIVAQYWK